MPDENRPRELPRAVGVELIQDLTRLSEPDAGFLRRHRHRAKTLLEDGTRTETYVVDFVDRAPGRRDAVAVAIFARGADAPPGATEVLLRRQLRYPVHIVSREPLFTEVVAGIIEPDEDPAETVVREVFEEAGIHVALDQIESLGPPFYVSPGMSTEQILPYAVRVDASHFARGTVEVPGDGSAMEQGAELIVVTLDDALSLALVEPEQSEAGIHLADAKTEIVLRRLIDRLQGESR